jgi:signal transduction histidine kinase
MLIKTRLQLSTAASICIALIIFFAVLSSHRETVKTLQESYSYNDLLNKVFALNMLSESYAHEPRQRPRATEQWQTVYSSLGEALTTIRLHEGEEKILFSAIHRNYVDLGRLFDQLVEVTEGPEDSALSESLEKRLQAQLLVKLRMMMVDTSRLLDESHARILRSEQQAGFTTILLIIMMIGFTAALLYYISRKISTSIAELQKGTMVIAEGDLTHQIPVRGDDEIDQLANAFNRMSRQLHSMTQDLNESVRSLELEVEERQRVEGELLIYASKLERSNKQLEDFAFIASHDLQEPLRKIMLLSDRLGAGCDARHESGCNYVERLNLAAHRMRQQVRALLAYSRITGKSEAFREVNLGALAREVALSIQQQIDEAGGQVEIQELPIIRGDPEQMRQLLLNLIENALKFRGVDPPSIKVYSRHPDADSDIDPETIRADSCLIFVEDNGIGFDEKYQERIFSPFQRLHHRDRFGGTGIGLAICRKIVESHGGTITARSTPGKGALFIIALPAQGGLRRRELPSTQPQIHKKNQVLKT